MNKIFSCQRVGKYEYLLSLRVNLKAIAKALMVVCGIALAVAIGWLLWMLVSTIAGPVWSGICWLASQWMWLLGAVVIALLAWLLSKVNWKAIPRPKLNPNFWKWLLGVLAVLLLVMLVVFGVKSCTPDATIATTTASVADDTPWNFNWLWLVGAGIVALLAWLLTKLNRKAITPLLRRWWVLVLGLLLLLLWLLFGGKSCVPTPDPKITKGTGVPTLVVENTPEFSGEFESIFHDAVVWRAWLDGVQKLENGKKPKKANKVFVVGIKYFDGKPIDPKDFADKSYDEAVRIIAQEWEPIVHTHLEGIALTRSQLTATLLFAMRNGDAGFENSDFLKALKAGKIDEASSRMHFHYSGGKRRTLHTEAQQYMWCLKQCWSGNLTTDVVMDLPAHSYKALPLAVMFEDSKYTNKAFWDDTFVSKLEKGEHDKKPRVALDL